MNLKFIDNVKYGLYLFSVIFNVGTREVCESSGTLFQNNQNIPSLPLMFLMLEMSPMCQLLGGEDDSKAIDIIPLLQMIFPAYDYSLQMNHDTMR